MRTIAPILGILLLLTGLTTLAAGDGGGTITKAKTGLDHGTVWMATWDGRIYIMYGDKLLMLDEKLAIQKSVDMPSHGERGQTAVGLQICADGSGVYLLQPGHLTIFDHDLNIVTTGPLPEQVATEPTPPVRDKRTGDTEAETVWSNTTAVRIPKGSVEFQYSPAELVPGRVLLRVRVIKFPKQLDSRATLSAAIGPRGITGDYITFRRTGRGEYMTTANLLQATVYELKLRVERGPANVENVSFYLNLTE